MVALLRSWASLVTAQSLGERTQFLEEVFYRGVFCEGFREIRCRGSVFISGRFSGEFVALFQHISFGFCDGLGETAFFLEEGSGGDFRRLTIFYMVSGFCPGW